VDSAIAFWLWLPLVIVGVVLGSALIYFILGQFRPRGRFSQAKKRRH